jgi:NAD+ kinase
LKIEADWFMGDGMLQPITSLDIITKNGHARAYALGRSIQAYLKDFGIAVSVFRNSEYKPWRAEKPEQQKMILVLGGDGTLLSVLRKRGEDQVPVLGMNFGQVGFLTELTPDGWEQSLEAIVKGHFHLSSRIMLHYDLHRQGDVVESGRVINDLLVGRGETARLIKLHLWTEGGDMGTVRADGLIVSTPIGSTAYAVAAGGALINHELEVLEICAVCPFMSGFKPLILPSRTKVWIQVEPSSSDVYLTLDGQSGTRLRAGDRIAIRESAVRLQFVQNNKESYINKLRLKGYL